MGRINLHVGRKTTKDPLDAGYVEAINEDLKVIEQNLQAITQGLVHALPEAVEYGAQPIFDKSQMLVPVDTGKLKASGFMEAHATSRGTQLHIGYGKYDNPDYTIFVHERVDINHAPPTQAKFLTTAVDMHVDELVPRVQEYLASIMPEGNSKDTGNSGNSSNSGDES